MLTIEHKRTEIDASTEASTVTSGAELYFASGLLGFERNQLFELITDPELSPYQWLRGKDADQSFLVIPPGYVVENYNIDLADEDVALLGLENPEDAVVLNIATYHPDETVTVNLKGPIVYNQVTKAARQIVPRNAADLSLAHPVGN
jgi:flagellar assembly factor FliW|tara:strand:+ start:1043 stop:1483 length:441 start_codon:yes stop_codon:yes gene_type:complete